MQQRPSLGAFGLRMLRTRAERDCIAKAQRHDEECLREQATSSLA